jgi:hypothetical protein
MRPVFGSFDDAPSPPVKSPPPVEENVSIDDSLMIFSSRANRSTIDQILGPTKLSVFKKQRTNSTASNSSSEDDDDDSKACPFPTSNINSMAMSPTRRTSNLNSSCIQRNRNMAMSPTRRTSNLNSSFTQQNINIAMDPTRSTSKLNSFYTQQERQLEPTDYNSNGKVNNLNLLPTVEAPATDFSEAALDYSKFEDGDTDRAAAWAIHLALIFFATLVVISLILSFVVIHNYGFVTLLLLSVVLGFCIGLAWFVDRTVLSKNEKLRPIRTKIIHTVETAKQALADEIHNFQQDWKDYHLLLTTGESEVDDDDVVEFDESTQEKKSTKPTQAKSRKKSVLFKMVKPFLGARQKVKKRKKEKKKKKASQSVELV